MIKSVRPLILGMGLFGSLAAAQPPAAPPTPPAANPNVDFHFRYLNGLDPAQGWRRTPSGLRYRKVSGRAVGRGPAARPLTFR